MSDTASTPDPSEAVRAELVAIEDDWALAIVSNDVARIAAFMTEDWVIVSDSGILSAQRFLSVIQSGELTHSAMVRAGASRIRVHGDTAVVTERVTSTAYYRGRRLDADEWATDVFVRPDGRWLCALTQVTAATTPA
jgi:ketosteroid isomerase-like protein